MGRLWVRLVWVSVLVALSGAVTGAQERDYWPTKGWRSATPEQEGMDSAVLGRMVEEVKQNMPQVTSLLVVRHGYLVLEEYFGRDPEALMPIWQGSMSILSGLLGIAKDNGRVKNVDQTVLSFFPEHRRKPVQPSAKKLTIRHLLTMSSGLGASFGTPDPRLFESAITYPPINEPGVKFTYNESDPAIVSLLIAKATKQETVAYARKHLFAPLGIEELRWGEDTALPGGAHHLCLKPRDMAKIGYLYLNQGFWDGKQIISAEWVRESTSKQTNLEEAAVPRGHECGYYWWLDTAENHRAAYAYGGGGQIIYLIPELDLVYVSTSTSATFRVCAQLDFPEKYLVPAVFK